MSKWIERPLGSLTEIVSGGTPSREIGEYWGGDIPWVTPTDITSCSTNYLSATADRITKKGLLNSSAKVLPSGSILFTSRATVGLSKIAVVPVCTNQGFKSLIPSKEVDGTFLLYQVQRLRGEFERFAAGSTFPEINKKDTARVSIPHPVCSRIQQKIAVILIAIDTAIEKTEALAAKYQQIKAGLMHDLFTRGVLPNGQLRPPRSEAPELYQETAIGWIPRGWEVSGLASKGRSGTNWIRTGPFGSALKGEHWRLHGHPVITIGALGEGVFTHEELLFVSKRDAARLLDFQLKADDVVFSRVADVGRSVVVRDEQAGWIMSSNLMRIAVDEGRARPDFLQMALAGDARIKSQIRARVNSSGRDVANSEVLSQLRFVWPDISEQDQIIALSNRASRNLISAQEKAAKLHLQKFGLMQDLLTGKVSVQVDEPEACDA
ncbi:EcoKI restriction-modification system protein HsdS [Janthinobacterium sp. MP5059B]|uniref:restriction endonuclease subunit S n=1 Tax=Janthinobacterium sp. MP5059B TaxID=1766683 RepID=UPI000892FA34|nr:restriction endonuclease subunit S [Janthinobacterium sp. MP5059B]OEZ48389.1 EcoKI restriction-modification system protein HsdS [Janthinobacterium sp. MP5059B]